jgi:hypothetical protein
VVGGACLSISDHSVDQNSSVSMQKRIQAPESGLDAGLFDIVIHWGRYPVGRYRDARFIMLFCAKGSRRVSCLFGLRNLGNVIALATNRSR